MAIAAAAQLLVLPLSQLAIPQRGYFGQLAPGLGGLGQFSGTVSSVRLGGVSIRSEGQPWEFSIRDSLLAGAKLEIRASAGDLPESLSPLFNVVDIHHHFDMMVMQDRHDLLFRYRSLGEALGLAQIELTVDDAFGPVAHGQPFAVTITYEGRAWCFHLPAHSGCRALGPGALWRFLSPSTARGATWLDAAWLLLFFLPIGYLSLGRSAVVAPLLAVVPLPLFLASSGLGPILWALLGAAAGVAGGHAARVASMRHSLRSGTGTA